MLEIFGLDATKFGLEAELLALMILCADAAVLLVALFSTGWCRKKLFHESTKSTGYCMQVCFGPICQVILFVVIVVCMAFSAFLLVTSSMTWTLSKVSNGVCDGPYEYVVVREYLKTLHTHDQRSNTHSYTPPGTNDTTSVEVREFWTDVVLKSDIFSDIIVDDVKNFVAPSGYDLCVANAKLYTETGRCVMSWSWISFAQLLMISKIIFTLVHLRYDMRKETEKHNREEEEKEEEQNDRPQTRAQQYEMYGNQASGIELGQSHRYSNFETDDTVTISKMDLLDLQRRAAYTKKPPPDQVTISKHDLLELKSKIPTEQEKKVLLAHRKGELKRKDSSRTETLRQRELNILVQENRVAREKIEMLERSDREQKKKIGELETSISSIGLEKRIMRSKNKTSVTSASAPSVPGTKKSSPKVLDTFISAMSDGEKSDDEDDPPGFTPRNALDVPEGLGSPKTPGMDEYA